MNLSVYLYGSLRSMVPGSKACEDTVLSVDYIEGETFEKFAERLGLKRSDLGDCFINGTLAKQKDIVPDGARVGLFPFNMVLLCGGQHLKGHGYTRLDLDIDHY